jgi:adenosylhomocysteine nucleosidase
MKTLICSESKEIIKKLEALTLGSKYLFLEIPENKVGIGVEIAKATHHNSINLIINIGYAYGSTEGIIVPDEFTYADVDVRCFDYDLGQVPKMPSRYKLEESLKIKCLENSLSSGVFLSGDSPVHSQENISDLLSLQKNAVGLDSTSTPLAQTAFILDIDFCSIKYNRLFGHAKINNDNALIKIFTLLVSQP